MPDSTNTGKHYVLRVLFIVAVAAVLFVVLVIGYSSITNLFKTSKIPEFKAKGQLILSVATLPIHTDEYGSVMTVNYDLARGAFNIPNPDKPGTIEYQYRLVATTTRPWILFVRATGLTDAVDDISTVPFEVYRANLHNVKVSQLNDKIHQAEKVTNDSTTVKQFPEISARGDVIYMARVIGRAINRNAEDWSVHYVPNNGNDEIVAQGSYPKWVNDNQFVYLKNDGLYSYTISTGEESRLWGLKNDTLSDDVTLYVSDDAHYVVVAVPDKNWLFIFKADKWDTQGLTLRGVIPVAGRYPVISHDNRYVALLTRTSGSSGDEIPTISFIEVSSLQVIPSATFSVADLFKAVRDNVAGYVASTYPGTSLPDRDLPNDVNSEYLVLNDWVETTSHH
jgi:hypothetical protein